MDKWYIADFHIHTKYSRATSKNFDLDAIVDSAKSKGVSLVGTGDFTHPVWFQDLSEKLEYKGKGIYTYKDIDFILSVEVNNIFSQGGKLRKVHSVIILPELEIVKEFNKIIRKYGKLESDGRPILTTSLKNLAHILFDIYPDAILIPAHIWTPWFGLLGSKSGFDSIEEAFGEYAEKIYALETGLSSDPPMNWRLSSLDKYTLVSNSDAHSPANIGREANVFTEKIDYFSLLKILKNRDKNKFAFTVEFFPEEGKYHFDGHRNCNVSFHPREAKKMNNICPVCGKPLTIGVLHRVDDLSNREEGYKDGGKIPYKRLVPLNELIGETLNFGKASKAVQKEYKRLITVFGNEFEIMINAKEEDLHKYMEGKLVNAIKNIRTEKLDIQPGYDGVYGKVNVLTEQEEKTKQKQKTLF